MFNLYQKQNDIQYNIIHKDDEGIRESVYHLWYEVYCRGMGRNLHYADHKNEIITDGLEPHSHLITANMYDRVVGSFRINFPEEGKIAYYNDLYKLNDLKNKSVGIGTRYMVDPDYRGLYISHYLIDKSIEYMRALGKDMLIIDCSPAVYGLFEKLGFTDLLGEKQSSEYGRVRIMKYDIPQAVKKPHLKLIGE